MTLLARSLLMLLLAALVAGTWAPSARAATFDPELTWRTLRTEHFHITFHQGEEALAERFSLMAEEVYDTLTADMRWQTRRRIEVLLIDRTDTANGYAGTVPYPRIVIFVTAPYEDSTLGLYEDWMRAIFVHELTHVLHLDTNHGIVRAARAVVGRIASTNEISPRWMVEGLATYQETQHTSGGRGRTPMADMLLRTAVLQDAFPPLGNLDGYQPRLPGGNLRYLFGESFIRFVAEQQGEDVWTRWTHTYGSHVPYLLPSRKVFGRRLVPLYFDWRAHLEARYAAQAAAIEAEGVREGQPISAPGASCTAPAFAPDGEKLVWSCYDLRTGAAIWTADGAGQGPSVLLQDHAARSFTWRRDSKALVYATTHIVNRFNTWSDIYLLDLARPRPVALTTAKRARDPDFSPDGSKLMVVTNKVGNNQLEMLTVDRILEPLTAHDDGTQYATPRWSPDGRALAVSIWEDGQRDLWLIGPDGTRQRRLTLDRAIETDPRWSADGRWLYFASDRTGVFNVYAIDTTTERLFQVTNVVTGAMHPSPHPDGTLLAYQQYARDGWEIRLIPLDAAAWLDRGLLPRPLRHGTPLQDLVRPVEAPAAPHADATAWWGERPLPARGGPVDLPHGLQSPGEVLGTFEQIDVKKAFGDEQDYPFTHPVRRYDPAPTLLPRYWLPYVQLTPFKTQGLGWPFGLVLSAATGSADMAAHIGWSAQASYRSDADFFGGSAALVINRWLPVFTLTGNRVAVPYGMLLEDRDDPGPDGEPTLSLSEVPYWERRHEATLTVSYPYKPRASVFGRYAFTLRENLDPLPENAYLPRIPIRGTIGRLSAGWRYAWSQPTPYAITTEDGRVVSLVASLLTPWLGTTVIDATGASRPLTQVQLTAEWNEYVVNPWVPNHVLAWRVAGGAALGGTDFLGTYQLGGNIGDSPFYLTPDEFRMLRGHPFGAAIGDYYWLTGAEYRFPLLRVERGVGTIPAYVRTISALVFIDAGNALSATDDPRTAITTALVGVGGELRFNVIVGWNLGLTGRLGYGVGLGERGFAWNDPRTVYFRLGGSF